MAVTVQGTRDIEISALTRYPGNPRRGNIGEIRASVRRLGQYRPIVVRDTGTELVILAGNHTTDALAAEGAATVRAEVIQCDDDEARRVNLADNRLAELGSYDEGELAAILAELDGDYEGTGWNIDDIDDLADSLGRDEPTGGAGPEGRPSLADRFLIPPFDVLDSRQGWWRERKKAWIGLGIQSELGRSGNTLNSSSAGFALRMDYSREEKGLTYGSASGRDPTYYEQKAAAEQQLGRTLTTEEFETEHYQPSHRYESGTSIFDPVLCELAYRWFSPSDGVVLDPFAGGSVRGLMAAMLGRTYIGNDLSADQVKANAEQADGFAVRGLIDRDAITWTVGNSAEWVGMLAPDSADFLLTCPPYLWLERYSDDPADLSTMTAAAFEETYTRILAGAAKALRPDRYAVIVVGDVREDRTGRLVDFRAMTIRAAAAAGLTFVSGAILVTQVGSLAVRVSRAFTSTRTLGRTHQDVLVFCKGSRSRAAQACGDVDVHIPDEIAESFNDSAPEQAA